MKIFLSWSGPRSRHVALALRNWLPLVVQTLEPWMSEEDIEAGRSWSDDIARSLGESDFGIVCVTPENLEKPWLMFESGALAKRFDIAKVVPYLFDAEKSVLAGNPLSRFQAKKANRKETLELLRSVNSATAKPIEEVRLERTFGAFWDQLEAELAKVPKPPEGAAHPSVVVEDVLNFMWEDIQRLSQKVDDVHTMVAPRYLPGAGLAALAAADPQPATGKVPSSLAPSFQAWLSARRVQSFANLDSDQLAVLDETAKRLGKPTGAVTVADIMSDVPGFGGTRGR